MAGRRPGRFRRTTLPDLEIKLDCSHCQGLTEFVRDGPAVYCETCGKRHSRDSLVDTSLETTDEDRTE